MKKVSITLPKCLRELPAAVAVTRYALDYTMVDAGLIGQAEKQAHTKNARLEIKVPGTIKAMWLNHLKNEAALKTASFRIGFRHIENGIENGRLFLKDFIELSDEAPSPAWYPSPTVSVDYGRTVEIKSKRKKDIQIFEESPEHNRERMAHQGSTDE